MTTARWRDVEYELVNFTRGPPPQWVLRDKTGDVLEMDIEDVVAAAVVADPAKIRNCGHGCRQRRGVRAPSPTALALDHRGRIRIIAG